MHKLYYKIKLLAPIILSKNQGDMNSVPTSDEFSGTAVLGAIASSYIRERGISKDEGKNIEFHNWFTQGSLKFHHAKLYKDGNIFIHAPFSTSQEKNANKPLDIYDLLLRDNEEDYKYKPELLSIRQGVYSKASIEKNYNFHHVRDSNTGSSKEGGIFNYESIEAGQEFAGFISGNETELASIQKWFGEKRILFFGRSRNAQYGKVELSVTQEKVFKEYKLEDPLESKLTITLLTDTILLNENGFCSVNKNIFEKYLQANIEEAIKIEKCFLKQDDIKSYNAKWKLRRPSDTCFQAGSCFSLDISKCKDKQNVIKNIQAMLELGVGERTLEGYGEAVLNLQVYDTISFYEENIEKPSMPKTISDETKNIIKQIYTNQCVILAEKKALEDINNLERLKGTSTSIVSRLEGLINEKEGALDLLKDNSEILKSTAKKILERIRINQQTLYSYLGRFQKDNHNKPISIEEILKQNENEKLKKFRNEFTIQNNKNFIIEFEYEINIKIRNAYLKLFFSSLRKQIKLNNKTNGEIQ